MTIKLRFIAVSGLLILLQGCAGSSIPKVISTAIPNSPTVTQAHQDIERFINAQVRWGGTIATIRNMESETLVEVVGRKLKTNGRPKSGDQSEGRFQAKITGFLDPVIFEKGRSLTIVGILVGEHSAEIDEHPYRYPLIEVTDHHLWEPLPSPSPYYYDPWFYDPWRPYPYHYSPHHRRHYR